MSNGGAYQATSLACLEALEKAIWVVGWYGTASAEVSD